MSGRKKLIFANWKMHFSVKQATAFAKKLSEKKIDEGVVVAVAPATISLSPVSETLAKCDIATIAQNGYHRDEGAFTGETSMPMLRGIAKFVLVGHSERRHVFNESNELIRAKMSAAVRSGIKPILCIGETLMEKEHYHTSTVISSQLEVGLADLTSDEVGDAVIAYEPVWALSNGKDFSKHKMPAPDDIKKAVDLIRGNIKELYGIDAASKVKILYGGSSNADNATAILSVNGLDGLLVGGASLGVATFWPMVEAAGRVYKDNLTDKK
ncbi:triose-phosphate isomerase [Candidatus Nomurabacteria bacterium]|nr:triose-phosphate isomerase [Candidatus Nomurabacteria bacterium]